MTLDPVEGVFHSVRRSSVFSDVLKIYGEKSILREFPIYYFEFEDEMAVDQGSHEICFLPFGRNPTPRYLMDQLCLFPCLTDTSILPVVGSIVSHGYLVSGFLPVRVALPCRIGILCGPGASIPQPMLCEERFSGMP